MPIKLANVNIMSQLTSRGLDNTSSAFVSDIYIYRDGQNDPNRPFCNAFSDQTKRDRDSLDLTF